MPRQPRQPRQQAQAWVNNRVRSGKIVRPKFCDKCGHGPTIPYSYHANIDVRDEFMWLCKKCYHQFVPVLSEGMRPDGIPIQQQMDLSRALPDFATLCEHIWIDGMGWTDIAKKYGVLRNSAFRTFVQRCKRRGLNPDFSHIRMSQSRRSAQTVIKKTNENTISAVGILDDIRECSELFELPHRDIFEYVGDKRVTRMAQMLRGDMRPRLPFEMYEMYSKGLERLRAEYADYPQKRDSVRERCQALLRLPSRRFNNKALALSAGILPTRLSFWIWQTNQKTTHKTSLSLEELRRLEAAVLEFEAWWREMEQNELIIKGTRPKGSRKEEPASACLA